MEAVGGKLNETEKEVHREFTSTNDIVQSLRFSTRKCLVYMQSCLKLSIWNGLVEVNTI